MPACIDEMIKVIEINDSVKIVTSKREFIVEDSFLSEDSKKKMMKSMEICNRPLIYLKIKSL